MARIRLPPGPTWLRFSTRDYKKPVEHESSDEEPVDPISTRLRSSKKPDTPSGASVQTVVKEEPDAALAGISNSEKLARKETGTTSNAAVMPDRKPGSTVPIPPPVSLLRESATTSTATPTRAATGESPRISVPPPQKVFKKTSTAPMAVSQGVGQRDMSVATPTASAKQKGKETSTPLRTATDNYTRKEIGAAPFLTPRDIIRNGLSTPSTSSAKQIVPTPIANSHQALPKITTQTSTSTPLPRKRGPTKPRHPLHRVFNRELREWANNAHRIPRLTYYIQFLSALPNHAEWDLPHCIQTKLNGFANPARYPNQPIYAATIRSWRSFARDLVMPDGSTFQVPIDGTSVCQQKIKLGGGADDASSEKGRAVESSTESESEDSSGTVEIDERANMSARAESSKKRKWSSGTDDVYEPVFKKSASSKEKAKAKSNSIPLSRHASTSNSSSHNNSKSNNNGDVIVISDDEQDLVVVNNSNEGEVVGVDNDEQGLVMMLNNANVPELFMTTKMKMPQLMMLKKVKVRNSGAQDGTIMPVDFMVGSAGGSSASRALTG
ncbi:hypothetical protein GGS21DRAFT_125132 [Xylaria nigripes]|nr:hypothetical protein GGS21DRAFT_125132 [Xylaria nigripes]